MPINYKNPEKTKITFGTHKNKSIAWLYENEKSYLDFILSQDFFKKFDYYSVFKNYTPPADHIKYCRDNGIKFCHFCCKKKRRRKTDIGDNFNFCGVCYNGDNSYACDRLMNDMSEDGMRRKKEIKDKIDKKQLAEYKKSLKTKK
jgi:hypothetical protein